MSTRQPRCACAHHPDGTTTTFLCPIHAEQDPCLTKAQITGKRRRGTTHRGRCSTCSWQAHA